VTRSDSLQAALERTMYTAMRVKPKLQWRLPIWWRCQELGTFAKESCRLQVEPVQGRGHQGCKWEGHSGRTAKPTGAHIINISIFISVYIQCITIYTHAHTVYIIYATFYLAIKRNEILIHVVT
jgi:hypothetical protein